MAISKVEHIEASSLLEKLSSVIDLNKDLPMNVFIGSEFLFWFFERPLLCFHEIFAGLILENFSSYKSNFFIKFSGSEHSLNSCYSFDGCDVDRDVLWLNNKFESFFDGTVDYPIILCDSACNWIAFESAHEEFGVIAVKASAIKDKFYAYLNSNFISMDEMTELASSSSREGVMARALISSYHNKQVRNK
ncbi:hypothetical protein [Pseudomonas viridiflava]|uniref:hypothetical protein n=1 Tax=Pseudomonas viridiflava TaxID=33069 RepID=UPI000F0581B5|nr:hypothetical protein [Pseudomonas viridiflava]